MSQDSEEHTCTDCDYKSKWKCNMTRHMIRKHPAPNVHFPAPNVHFVAPNVHFSAPNVHFSENSNLCKEIPNQNSNNNNKCKKCQNIFSRKSVLDKHTLKCKGNLNILECEYCHKIYATRKSKSNHFRICKAKKEADMCALVVAEPKELNIGTNEAATNQTQPSIVQNINNNTTINNSGTINNNNTIIQNIIVYDPKNMELLNDHISKGELKKMISNFDFSKVLTDYSTALLSRKENQCVRKTNLRSTSSAIHVGDDKWEYQSDKEVLPKLLSNIATNFGNIKHDYKIKIMEELDTFIIDVQAEAVDCHEDVEEEARLKELFKRTLTNFKHLLFNLTKQTIAEKRKHTGVN